LSKGFNSIALLQLLRRCVITWRGDSRNFLFSWNDR